MQIYKKGARVMARTAYRRRPRRSDVEREHYRQETAALIEAANREMEDPNSPILARLASADPEIGTRVRGYSLRNQVLLVQQAEERGLSLRQVATYREWRDLGRAVRQGERGLRIVGYRGAEDAAETAEGGPADSGSEPRNRFRMMAVFPIDQTTGADQENPGEPDNVDPDTAGPVDQPAPDATLTPAQRVSARLIAQVCRAGFEVADDPDQAVPVHIDHATRTVRLRPGDPDADTLRALSAVVAALASSPATP